MGSVDERKAIDASIGGLVWVRRRNGAWWPGKIMAHDEVSDGLIVSPKSGTPIKLLGREDASVDWYNLEKSKRVKAFRCGEYDTCIETAKATASGTGKKAVKYARREDAIVHALEIESEHLAKDQPEVPKGKDESSVKKASTSGVERRRGRSTRSSNGNEDSTAVVKTEDLSLEKATDVKAAKGKSLSGRRRRTPNDSEEDGTGGTKRMRGLEDIGTGVGSKGKEEVDVLLEPKQENGFQSDVNMNGSVSNGTLANGSSASTKRTRAPVVNANEYSKRKTRQRPLTKVLESTAVMSVPVTSDVVNTDGSPNPGVSESNNADCNGNSCENVAVPLDVPEIVVEAIHDKVKEKDSSSISVLAGDDSPKGVLDVPLTEEEKYSAGVSATASSPRKALDSGLTVRCVQNSQDDVLKTEGNNESACKGPVATLVNGIEESTPTWQLKGKRNSRQMSKNQEERRTAYAEEASNNSFRFGTLAAGRCSQLYDVKIEVKSNYTPREVPLISLMSKLSGEAIVGHPLTVIEVEDGSWEHVMESHMKPLEGPVVDDDVKPKASGKKKSKKKIPPSKSSKPKKSAALSKKTRCLSALSGQKVKKVVANEQIVACIPLKVVFSRINEAVKGSARQANRALPSA